MFLRNGKWTIWVAGTWLACGILGAFFDRVITDALWIVAGILYLGFWAIGVLLLAALIIYAFAIRNRFAIISSCLLLAGATALLLVQPTISSQGNRFIVRYRFKVNFSEYETIIAETKQGKFTNLYNEREGVRFLVELGPPVRVAFPQPGGILDNWEGIVYDPTGEVLKARGWTEPGTKLSAPPEIVGLFGGNIVTCSHVESNYYRCWFT